MRRECECQRCGGRFEFESAGRARRVCPKCQSLRPRACDSLAPDALEGLLEEFAIATEEEVAARVGIGRSRVQQLTWSAIAKIRAHPGLRALWQEHRGQEPAVRPEPAAPSPVLTYARQIREWRATAQWMAAEGLVDEALDVLAEVEHFERVCRHEDPPESRKNHDRKQNRDPDSGTPASAPAGAPAPADGEGARAEHRPAADQSRPDGECPPAPAPLPVRPAVDAGGTVCDLRDGRGAEADGGGDEA